MNIMETGTAGDAPTPSAADTARAANRKLLQRLVAGLLEDPEADLMALIPSDYAAEVGSLQDHQQQDNETTKLAHLNRKAISALLARFEKRPTDDLTNAFPPVYSIKRERELEVRRASDSDRNPVATDEHSIAPEDSKSTPFFGPTGFLESTTLKIIAPLSSSVDRLVQQSKSEAGTEDTVAALHHLIRHSEPLWLGCLARRFVSKLSNDLVVKAIRTDQSNHHTALELLAEKVPDLPIPRSHGLVWLGRWSLLFMSYVPKHTLTEVWPNLSYPEKLSLTKQLNGIFEKVRQIEQDNRPLGLVNGQGVVEQRGREEEFQPERMVQNISEFEEFVFSYKPWVSDNYIRFLKLLLPPARLHDKCVFTHTDVRPDNIMVDWNGEEWKISGVIDWDGAGYYPPYWEAVKSTRTFLANNDSDWYLMQPQCIAPSTFANQWLVDRLWEEIIDRFSQLDKSWSVRKAAEQRQRQNEELWAACEKGKTAE
ncbi:hypothetical protein HII31_05533 [Pseudocercospora fuligena]|uniref:Aminoglycoside phosphotransferase domain-containing protein n=1 Tax=Pseudocercospora fuligena TaxID=685502 RepID=A0A8H6RL94_9PEZI|nr:hypothetical protein HII31_05533 [Pseudocercospora fuligena]